MENVIPERLMAAERAADFLAWLRVTYLDREDRKQLLMHWADRVGIKVTQYMIKSAGID
jgi:hypothetical protein